MMFLRTCRRSDSTKDTKRSKGTKRALLFVIGSVFVIFDLFVVFVSAQGVDPALLLKPTPDSWPTYHGDYSGQEQGRGDDVARRRAEARFEAVCPAQLQRIQRE